MISPRCEPSISYWDLGGRRRNVDINDGNFPPEGCGDRVSVGLSLARRTQYKLYLVVWLSVFFVLDYFARTQNVHTRIGGNFQTTAKDKKEKCDEIKSY